MSNAAGPDFAFRSGLPVSVSLEAGVVDHWAIPLDVAAPIEATARKLLSSDEIARADRFHFERDRRRHTVAHAALRLLLAAYTQSPVHDIGFALVGRGKPVLDPPTAGLHFNLSHSGDMALLALARDTELGTDIEHIRPLKDLDALAERTFSAAEYASLHRLTPAARETAFFRCWTRKEAYIKAIAEGLYAALDRFEVSLGPDEPARIVTIEGSAEAADAWSVHHLVPADGYVGATALRAKSHRTRTWTFDSEAIGQIV